MLAPAIRHEAEELRVEKRHQIDGRRPGLPLRNHSSRGGGGSRLDRRDSVHSSSDRGENRKPMRRVKTKRAGDRDVRGWFASNHRR